MLLCPMLRVFVWCSCARRSRDSKLKHIAVITHVNVNVYYFCVLLAILRKPFVMQTCMPDIDGAGARCPHKDDLFVSLGSSQVVNLDIFFLPPNRQSRPTFSVTRFRCVVFHQGTLPTVPHCDSFWLDRRSLPCTFRLPPNRLFPAKLVFSAGGCGGCDCEFDSLVYLPTPPYINIYPHSTPFTGGVRGGVSDALSGVLCIVRCHMYCLQCPMCLSINLQANSWNTHHPHT